MRITGGTSRGTPLDVPPGRQVRPTRDAVRQALFNILGDWIQGKRVLDLYAGSGSLGLEALSRGAASAVFVERDDTALACIRMNLEKSRLLPKAEVVKSDVLAFLSAGVRFPERKRFNAVLADPPFAMSNTEELGGLVKELGSAHLWAAGEQVCVVEVEAELAPLALLDQLPGTVELRTYGRNLLAISRRTAGNAPVS